MNNRNQIVIRVIGLTGSGKTTVAREIAEHLSSFENFNIELGEDHEEYHHDEKLEIMSQDGCDVMIETHQIVM